MEKIHGNLVKDIMDSLSSDDRFNLAKKIGYNIGLMHNKDIIHGDITSSNMMVADEGNFVFLDFGLGSYSDLVEDKATDLLVLKKSFQSIDYEIANETFDWILDGYIGSYEDDLNKNMILNKIKEIELKAAEYKSKFEGLQKQLEEQVKTERETIVNEIKSIDPETNMDAINGMSMVQLSAYKASLDRLSNLGSRKGFKGDESASTEVDTPVEMSAPEESKTLSRTEIARLTIASLQKQRILC